MATIPSQSNQSKTAAVPNDANASGRSFGATELEMLREVLERGTLVGVERVERVRSGEVVQVVTHVVTSRKSRSLMSPSRMRVLTVPSGVSRSTATSRYVCPP